MRQLLPVFGLLLLTACGGPALDEASTIDAVMAANAAKDQAMIARDAASLGRFYTDDYRVIDDDGAIHDKANQIEFMTGDVQLLQARSDEVRVQLLDPDAALVTGRLTGRYRMDGEESDFVERYTGVWVRQGPDWRVKHEHGSLIPQPG